MKITKQQTKFKRTSHLSFAALPVFQHGPILDSAVQAQNRINRGLILITGHITTQLQFEFGAELITLLKDRLSDQTTLMWKIGETL